MKNSKITVGFYLFFHNSTSVFHGLIATVLERKFAALGILAGAPITISYYYWQHQRSSHARQTARGNLRA
jgi:hypothetical protein